jgi:predicted aspartyl protease
MSETQQGFYSDLNEPLINIELLGKTDILTENRLFLIDSGFNGSMLVSKSLVKAMGWPMTDLQDHIIYGGGQKAETMQTFGYIRLLGKIIQINVLAVTSQASRSPSGSEIVGYIGMGLLKGSRIDFKHNEFHISTLEG